jgi:hypothetical protein
LIENEEHLGVLDVRLFTGADCDTEQYLVVAKFRQGPAVSKHMERFSLRKLNEVEGRGRYRDEISNLFA